MPLEYKISSEEIKELRKKLNLTQEKFAHLLGTNTSTVNRWENKKSIPSRLYVRDMLRLVRKNKSS